ncbi:PLDc N-terminal domain-containing protein [Maribacter sp. IgM3_T14_3]|uniref:PLDc N-terminal domain-containing protein n=1 Tax=Maribacter sp. IgM3_T14_3 TaxID=3415140 RepID=UPI003C7046B2
MEILKDFSFTLFAWQSFLIIVLLVWVYCIVDVLRHKFKNEGKATWLLIVLFLPILGSILYLSTGKSRRILND